MSYDPWTSNHSLLQHQEFCKLSDFVQFVRTLRTKKFHMKAHRDDVRNLMSNLYTGAGSPFGRTKRFPDDFFVHLNGAVQPLLLKLHQSIDLPDRQLSRMRTVGLAADFLRDPKCAYDYTMNALSNITLIRDPNAFAAKGIYDRENFERHFDLHWGPAPIVLN